MLSFSGFAIFTIKGGRLQRPLDAASTAVLQRNDTIGAQQRLDKAFCVNDDIRGWSWSAYSLKIFFSMQAYITHRGVRSRYFAVECPARGRMLGWFSNWLQVPRRPKPGGTRKLSRPHARKIFAKTNVCPSVCLSVRPRCVRPTAYLPANDKKNHKLPHCRQSVCPSVRPVASLREA